MGQAYLMWIYDDGIRADRASKDDRSQIASSVGDAVLKLCLAPDLDYGQKTPARITSQAVDGHGNCVNFCDEVHSTDAGLYAWCRNRLARLDQLTAAEFDAVAKLFDQERTRRHAAQS